MRYSYAPGSYAADARDLARRQSDIPAPPPSHVVIRPAERYDLARPGTPRGIVDLARAADAGGWRAVATLALAQECDSGDVVASLALRCTGDAPDRRRRAWAVWTRTAAGGWQGDGARLWEEGTTPVPRAVGLLELRALLQGLPWAPPPPRDVPMLACYTCDRVTRFSTTTWRPYANHRCETTTREGAR